MKNKLAICSIFKNEGLYVREWLDFHYSIGVGKFYIYLNNCDDDTYEKIKTWVHNELVEIIDWPMQPGQLQAYQHCINRKTDDEWIAFIDADEFLHSRNEQSIIKTLDAIDKKYTTIVVNWLVFGSSNLNKRVAAPVIDTFTKRSAFSFPANRMVKSIIRNNSDAIVRSSHFIETSGLTSYSNGCDCIIGHDGVASEFISTHLVINHYFTKSYEEWIVKKLRGRVSISPDDPQKIRSEEQFAYHDRNEQDDFYLSDLVKEKNTTKFERDEFLYIDSVIKSEHQLKITGWSSLHSKPMTSLIATDNNKEIIPNRLDRHHRDDVSKLVKNKNHSFGFTAYFSLNCNEIKTITISCLFYDRDIQRMRYIETKIEI